ncbi:MAG: hypothetical protein AAFV54_15085, partial [Pseudomonadota bacterium]
MHKGKFEEEIALAMDIFNDSWANNWNYVPFTDAQVQHMANDLSFVIQPDGFWFGEVDGVAKGFILLLPNINEAARGLDGRLFPFGWAKFLWRLKVTKVRSGRIPLNGIRQEVQKTRNGTALMLAMHETCYAAMRPHKMHDVEMGWVLETNHDVQNMIEMSAAKVYKRYRFYKKAL